MDIFVFILILLGMGFVYEIIMAYISKDKPKSDEQTNGLLFRILDDMWCIYIYSNSRLRSLA